MNICESPISNTSVLLWERLSNAKVRLVYTADIEKRSQNSYTAPCNGVVSHGDIQGFADHIRRKKRKQNASTILCALSRMFISTYAPDESQLFWSWEKLEYPQLEPHTRLKMAQVLRSPIYICGLYSPMTLYVSLVAASVFFSIKFFTNPHAFFT